MTLKPNPTGEQRIPIVFIHSGGDSYLACSLTQARKSNPGAEIYLIGDRFNRGFPGIHHLEWRDYAAQADAFEKVYQHRNTNSVRYELFCLQRWLILNEVFRKEKLSACLYMDSDVLIYGRADKIAAGLTGSDWTTSSPAFSPHFTFWLRPGALEEFCAFMFEAYSNPTIFARLEQHFFNLQAAGRPGGVCDMTVFRHFAALNTCPFRDISAPAETVPCDYAMGADEGRYEIRAGVKRIEWRDGMPFGFADGKAVPFQALHFQGPSKGRIFKHMRIGYGPAQLLYLWNRMVAKKGKRVHKWAGGHGS